jgi:PadR family transcriptional regulator PadR
MINQWDGQALVWVALTQQLAWNRHRDIYDLSSFNVQADERCPPAEGARRRRPGMTQIVALTIGEKRLDLQQLHLFTSIEHMPKRGYLGSFELMVMLTLIRLGDDAYGVTISTALEEQTGREVLLGSVYATLERLAGKGLVSSSLGNPTPERGGRAKRYFRITAKGLRELRGAQRVLTALWKNIPELKGGMA